MNPAPSSRRLEVDLLNLQRIQVDEAGLIDAARRACEGESAFGELSLVLVDADRMTEMNSQYRGECGPTDVLSFSIDGLIAGGVAEGDDPPFVIGEVIVCPEVAARQFADLPSELLLLITHGVLHLLGYDHDSAAAAGAMRRRESELCGRSGASSS